MLLLTIFVALNVSGPQSLQSSSAPQFRQPASNNSQFAVSNAPVPRFIPPKGYKEVQVPDFVADTYMRFASAETAHGYQISGIESRVGVLERDRELYDRKDIDSLNESRSKALVYISDGSTLFALVWGALAALFGYFLKSYISPRLRVLWDALGANATAANHPTYVSDEYGFAIQANDPEAPAKERAEDKKD